MNCSESTKLQIKIFEGLRLKAYKDSTGLRTIGYGHTKEPFPDTITKEVADTYFEADIKNVENQVMVYYSTYQWDQNEFDALCCFTFNCGAGNLKKLLDSGKRSRPVIAAKMLEYVHAGGLVLQGLVKRRTWEYDLFLSTLEEPTKETNKLKILYPYVKQTYRLRSTPYILNDNIIDTVPTKMPCRIIGKVGDFYYISITRAVSGNVENCFVAEKGVIWE